MVSRKSKLKLKKPHDNILHPPTTNNIFKSLISALESQEVIKSQLLKNTYHLLFQLSSRHQLSLGKGADLSELFMKTNDGEVRLSLRDLYTLSSILFKDLERKLNQLQSSKHGVSITRSLELEELNLLIRCCMVTLTMTFHLPQEHFLESGRVIVLIFKKLSLLEVAVACHENADDKKLGSCQCMSIGKSSSDSLAEVASLSSLHLSDSCIPSSMAVLEVLIDELLVHGCVRKYLHIICSFFSPTNELLFKHGPNAGDFGIMMEMIYSHFSLSVSDEWRLEEFLNKITWANSNDSKSSELSITACRILLQNPVVLSSPNLLQAHIVSLVSNVINPDKNTDPRLIDHCLSLFESSVTMYTQHMSILKTSNHSADARGNLAISHNETSQPSFESCIDPMKRQKLDETITALNNSWNKNLRRKFYKNKSALVASSIEYIDQIAPSLACRDEVVAFLKCMLTRAANDDKDIALPLNGDASLQDICLLASLLMLMSKSLNQSIWCLKCHSDQQRPMGYDFIVGVIKCFKDLSIRLPIQKFSYNIMENCNELRLMLIHFLGLLSLSFDSGLDFLVKSCISVIVALTNLFVFEGNIDALKLLVDSRSLSSERSLIIYEKPLVVAAKFQKIRTLYFSNASASNESTPTQDSVQSVAVIEETCSGEMYLNPRLVGPGNVSDFDDLADFVECKKGKDYVGWLKDRDKFRKRQIMKRAKRMWDKKRQAWRSMRRMA